MKKISFVLLLILLLSFSVPTSLVQATGTQISINGDMVGFNNSSGYPFVDKNNRTLVPFRITLEKFGAKVAWDNVNNMAVAEKDNIVIKVPIGKNYIFRNDEKIVIDTVSVTKDGRTYLPIRPVIEAFNGQVTWNSKSNSVIIKSESLAQEIHYKAWEDVATKALSQPQYKYGIYVSRSMAVKHPEIYLQADRLAYEKILRSQPGMKAYFENKTKNFQERENLLSMIFSGTLSEDSLLWSDIDVKEFEKMDYKEFYSGQPILNYIDIRMYGLATALQPNDMKMVPINMAEIVYFQEKDIKKNNPYILMTERGNAYVWSDNKLLECNGIESSQISEKVVLIYNEDYVWYPLMDRDDTNKDDTIDSLVNTYASDHASLPDLTKKEIELINILKRSTEIKNEVEEIKIKYHSSKIYTAFLRRQDFIDRNQFTVYDEGKNQMRELDTGFVYFVVAKNANFISPVTAHYASMAKELENEDLNTISSMVVNDFHEKTNTGRYDEYSTISALTLWGQSELIYTNIDDTWLTKSSNCMYSASNAAAIFESAGIKDLEVIAVSEGYIKDHGGHIYITLYKNGENRRIDNFSPYGEDNNGLINSGPSIFRGFVQGQDWVMFLDEINSTNMKTYSTKDKTWVLNVLDYIRNKSESKAILIDSLDPLTLYISGINIVDFINKFNSNNNIKYNY
ncbi:copper amine oxidase N-terminal domain-containing protein [Tissierella sp.]|uniref:copper amine oxidase N-terminal domain-containing protein n=1 Tax=Tissierella sp. TaxID=41274 RepID=UPI002854749C|nr:copper amine oxidase N-terminal domain-containing protein [Tissierella sp.]MDR7857685.1 copper amine oxidase N-terminal domain-containing protein [Tissierella sp.]